MQKEIIAVSIPVRAKNARVYFQVNMPADTIRIEGIEACMLDITGDTLVGNIAGMLQLQAVNKPNCCYQTVVRIGNSTIEQTVLGFDSQFSIDLVDWMTQPFVAAACKQLPEKFLLKGNGPLYGCYQDTAGVLSIKDISYNIGLYLHTVRKS